MLTHISVPDVAFPSKDHTLLLVAFPVVSGNHNISILPNWATNCLTVTPANSTTFMPKCPTPPGTLDDPVTTTPCAPPPSQSKHLISKSDMDSNTDIRHISRTMQMLKSSGYYYEGLSWQQASSLLKDVSVGTFLVRDSSDNRFLFALSVQTERGPTSVRIHYTQGQFRLDSEESLAKSMPCFSCVVQLVEHYIELSQSTKGHSCVWLDGSGRRDLPIRLSRPLYKEVPSLQHACRLAVNKSVLARTRTADELQVPSAMKDFIKEYPFPH